MNLNFSRYLRQYPRWETLILLLVLLAVSLHDWKSQTAFRVIVDGESMSPAYANNEMVWATSVYPRVVKDDIIIMQFNNESTIIKRVIYLPGDVFWVMNYDTMHWAPIPNDTVDSFKKLNIWPVKKITVPNGMFWIEGDNHSISYDSRTFGLIDMEYVRGTVTPWRARDVTKSLPNPVIRLYELQKQGKPITREKFIGNATGVNL